MKVARVLVIAQEIFPYLPESEISNLSRELLIGLQEKGREIRTFMPRYGVVNERRNQLHEVIRLSGMNLIIDDTDHPLIIKVASIPTTRIQVYFIDNEDYFQHRDVVSEQDGTEYADNDERAIFFARGVIETVKKLRWAPDIVHCHGWITALIPLYIKKNYADDPSFRDAKIVYSAYSNNFTTPLDSRFVEKLSMDGMDVADIGIEPGTVLSHDELVKLAVRYSDGVIASSPQMEPSLGEYVMSLGKSFLPSQDENSIEAYNKFYDEVCP
ncbi:MAG: glycogen/starch synthase [Bacteroidales bacterium]